MNGGATQSPAAVVELERLNRGAGPFIAKAVTFLITPLLLPLATSFAYYVHKWLGVKLDAAELTGYLTAIAAGVGITAYKYLANRGEWERTVLQLAHLYQVGQAAQSGEAPPP